jgi:hypothetical protein
MAGFRLWKQIYWLRPSAKAAENCPPIHGDLSERESIFCVPRRVTDFAYRPDARHGIFSNDATHKHKQNSIRGFDLRFQRSEIIGGSI